MSSLRKSMLQSALIWSIGDAVAQSLSLSSTRHGDDGSSSAASAVVRGFDVNRSAIAAAYGGLIFTPLASRWYQHVVRIFPHTTLRSISCRVASDQLIWSPVALAIYFSTMSMVHGGLSVDTVYDIRYKLGHVLPPTLVTNWVFWVPLQFLNFFFVSPSRWILTVNLAAIPWTAYLSWKEAK